MHIGLVGYICAGKDEVTHILQSRYGFEALSFGNQVRAESKKKGFVAPTRNDLQKLGFDLTIKYGESYLARLVHGSMRSGKYVIDGFRYPGQIAYFKETFKENFVLIGVTAPYDTRLARWMHKRSRAGDVPSVNAFAQADAIDRGEAPSPFSQQSAACYDLCEYTLVNEGTLDDLRMKVDELLGKIGKV